MKLNWFFEPNRDSEKIDIHLHPTNKNVASQITSLLQPERKLEVSDPITQRKSYVTCRDVFWIESMDHVSKLYTLDQQVFYLKGRLKEFNNLVEWGLIRINNTTILNLNQVISFQTDRNACLTVYTKNEHYFRISRHYTKAIRQQLLRFQVDQGGR
ncbi:LytTR family DNA-binding domain-containing protein [uncultured Enterococcus sp.]|uniref:LytTR family DNA-binding domain-containing protein n=1 Tax=uncultured Enterococcus sp. TaxID=167972 RepID=UPI0025EFF926|nr:LytTR family DNA-binding domain-containing protein [uncultured Enterococcus sp.]